MSDEKKLTDKELKKAFFILRHGSDEGLSEYVKAVLAIENEYNRQKEEIERLTERLDYFQKSSDYHEGNQKELEAQNAELQKNVDDWVRVHDEQLSAMQVLTIENKNLQKQVDELKKDLFNAIELLKEGGELAEMNNQIITEIHEQTVKDTAKEIYGEIDDSDILVVETQEYGEIEVVPMERLKEIIKSKGVEVE